jgi:hypothetical protein
MTVQKRPRAKKFYSVAEANAMLPLLRSILRNITELAQEMHERHERLARIQVPAGRGAANAYRDEIEEMERTLERDREQMREYEDELKQLNVELKDYFTGLVDFPCIMNGNPAYLCWRLGEPEVGYWHDLEAGFAGRQKLQKGVSYPG